MATIYNLDYEHISEGLQGSSICDEAIDAARAIAFERNEEVVLEDDDGCWIVRPDGSSVEHVIVDSADD